MGQAGLTCILHLQYLAKARRCCSPKDSMLAQSALVSRPTPASRDTLSKRGPSCTCLRTWHISWSDGTARMLLEDGEAALPLVSSALAPPLDVASLPVSKVQVSWSTKAYAHKCCNVCPCSSQKHALLIIQQSIAP